MAKYDSYKDSGVKWIGAIPSHWEIKKLRHVFSERRTLSTDGSELLLSVSEYTGITPSVDESGENKSRSESLIGYKKCNATDLIINIMLAWKRGLGISKYDGIVSPAYCVFETRNANPSFMHYLLRTDKYIAEFKRNSTGIIDSRLRMYPDDFKHICCVLPSEEEQSAIVSYLDEETGKIDRAIEAQRQMIDALNERKQIIITRAVTRGINPDAPLRDSGIPWLGSVPTHWEMRPLRHTFEMRNGYTPSKADPTLWGGNIPWYRMEDIRKTGRFLNESIDCVTKKALGAKGPFKSGSYILAICTASIGEHAMLIADSLANQRFANLKIRKSLEHRLSPMFVFYYMFVVGNYCRDNANSTCFQYVDMAALKSFLVPIPPIEEQNAIVAYLVNGTKEVEEALSNCERMITLLQERKQIIINEVVTGKKKVL